MDSATDSDTTATADSAPVADHIDAFFRREVDGQVRRAYLMLGSREAAEDVVADAFVEVVRRWARISEPGPYLNRCVLNGCRDHAGRNDRTPFGVDRTVADTPESVEMAELLSALPFRQRAAIVLRFHGGLKEAEIAATLGCRPGTVGSAIHRGLARLRKDLS